MMTNTHMLDFISKYLCYKWYEKRLTIHSQHFSYDLFPLEITGTFLYFHEVYSVIN